VPRVRRQVGVDLPELDVREVVALDRLLELPVDQVDLVEDVLRLSLLRLDPRRVGAGTADREENGERNRPDGEKQRRSVSSDVNCPGSPDGG
jgi:hypothetical protein